MIDVALHESSIPLEKTLPLILLETELDATFFNRRIAKGGTIYFAIVTNYLKFRINAGGNVTSGLESLEIEAYFGARRQYLFIVLKGTCMTFVHYKK